MGKKREEELGPGKTLTGLPGQLVEELGPGVATIQVPVAQIAAGNYAAMHVNLNLDKEQARTLKQLRAGLDQAGARLREGRRVQSSADTIRYLLENLK